MHNDAFNQDDMLHKLTAPDHFPQIRETLYNLQYEHERILKSTDECADIIVTVKAGIVIPELSVAALLSRLASQINSIGNASERCNEYVELLAREMMDIMNTDDAMACKEVTTPRESISTEKISPDSVCGSKKDLSWDNFESDRAFVQFKSNMDSVLMELEVIKNTEPVSQKTAKEKTSKGASIPQGQVPGYQDRRTEKCLESDRVIQAVAVSTDESNSYWFDKTQVLFKQLETTLLSTVDKQIEQSINRCANKLEKQQQHAAEEWADRQSKQTLKRCAKIQERQLQSSEDDELTSVDSQITKKCAKKQEREQHTEESDLAFEEGTGAYQELEDVKSRINHVQKLVQHLSTTAEVAETEKDKAYSHIDRLSSHMLCLKSDHDIQYRELEENLKSLSDREISLQRKCSNLEQERDEIENEKRVNTRDLQQKELELLKAMKKFRKMQNESQQTKAKLKSDNEELREQNCSIWRDYETVSTELEEKKGELKNLMDSMKNTEHSLISLFNTIGSIDDFLQRAREMNLFQ